MSSTNDDDAASNQKKRPRPSRVSNVCNRENRMNMDNHSTISSTTTKYIVRTGGAPVTLLIPVTISTPYIHPPNKRNAIKSLNCMKIEPLRALLALLPERFATTMVAQLRVALDLSFDSYSQFTQ